MCVVLALAIAMLPVTPKVSAGADRDRDGLRDGFEERWGVTEPHRRDSDRDGVIDAAEDLDGDRLGNLGEQRSRTDPSSRDSDGDGTGDGSEDADRDGKANALEQDARPIPRGLTPSLGGAFGDLPPSYSNGCHSGPYDGSIHPCVYAKRAGRVRVTLFGDSHALQWLPALTAAGAARGWRVVSLTKSGCPSVDVAFEEPIFKGASPSCRAWRAKGQRWLSRHRQDVVIISNSRGYALVDAAGRRLLEKRRLGRWSAGLARMIRALPERTTVLVLADTPHLKKDPPVCLRQNPTRMSRCVTRRKAAMPFRHDRMQRKTAERLGERFGSLSSQVCPYDPCPVVLGSELIWRNRSHLTATIARRLAPSMGALIEEVLAER